MEGKEYICIGRKNCRQKYESKSVGVLYEFMSLAILKTKMFTFEDCLSVLYLEEWKSIVLAMTFCKT